MSGETFFISALQDFLLKINIVTRRAKLFIKRLKMARSRLDLIIFYYLKYGADILIRPYY